MLVGAIPATALAGAGGEPFLTAGDVLPGRCLPETVVYGQQVDCSFPLARVAELDPWSGPHVADQDLLFDERNDEQADCEVIGAELVCRGVTAYFGFGSARVRPIVSGERAAASAGFSAVDWLDRGAVFTPEEATEPYVVVGGTLSAWLETVGPPDAVFARVTAREGGAALATLPFPSLPADAYEMVDVDVSALPEGRYRLTPCVGGTAATCEPTPGGMVFQVGTGELLEVVPGWNDRRADRINLVFVGSGFASVDEAHRTARALLGWEGPMYLGFDGEVLPESAPPEKVYSSAFGPFAIEPLASARSLFNIWLLAGQVADPRSFAHSVPPRGAGPALVDFGLPDVSVTALHLQPIGRYGRSQAGWTSFTTPEGPEPILRDGIGFAGSYIALPRAWVLDQAGTLAHEWGHALFDLRDEYEEVERGVIHGYPNCAPDRQTAEEWWGDLVGEVDPFAFDYIAAQERYVAWLDPFFLDRVTVGFEPGGCYSDDDAVRPTGDSLMNSGIPVFGSVNRRRVEEVLALWSGLVPLSGPAEIGVVCGPVSGEAPVARCRAEVAASVGVPDGRLQLTVGASTSWCSPEANEQDDAPTTLPCRPLPLAGDGPWTVTVGTVSGSVVVEIAIAAPASPVTTTVPSPVAAAPSPPRWPLALGAILLFVLMGATAVRRGAARRR